MCYISSLEPKDVGKRVLLVAGARPNFMKLAPVYRALNEEGMICFILHTGQHYDYKMSQVFFDDLGIPEPDVNLNVGSGSHSKQTAEIMIRFEESCSDYKPDIVIVFGDVNSTIACALVARKMGIPVAHVEAGLRSRDMTMPEEINRVLTDHISDFLFTTSRFADSNLLAEGIPKSKIHFVGNVMIDTLIFQMDKINQSEIMKKLALKEKEFDLLTLHRPSNVDNYTIFRRIIENFISISFDKKIIFPAHPRTVSAINRMDLSRKVAEANIEIIEPVGYHDFLKLVSKTRSVWTDSGGIQEETTYLGVPCYTVRENTERPETVAFGSNVLVKMSEERSFESYLEDRGDNPKKENIELWDGETSVRISKILQSARI